ncbi:MAG: sulfatase-like hydrolase/transferase, partial [Verrucomicrobiota bacterium]
AYFGCVTMLDHHIGRLMAYLEEKGLAEDTLVVFTSDNGPEHRTATAFGSSGILRGAKGHIHEGGIRVPGIVRWPAQIKAGSLSDEPVNGTDWMPTFSALAGVGLPTDRTIDGANVLPALLSGDPVQRETPLLWWLWHARGGWEVAMRQGDHKILATLLPQPHPGEPEDAEHPEDWSIMQFIKEAELGRFELYDLSKDPSESQELSQQEPERFQTLQKRMIALHADIRAEGPVYELGGKKKAKKQSPR